MTKIKFENWLVENDGKTENSSYSYKNAIPKLSKHFSEQTNSTTNLEDLDVEKLHEICEDYKKTGKYAEFGENSKGINRNALIAFTKYKTYLNSEPSHSSDQYSLKSDFLRVWPEERVKNMSLEEYTNLNREDSFCYWLESRTTSLGSIWGGSAYKFGVFKKSEKGDIKNSRGRQTDGEYGWYAKYGNTKEEVFATVKENILKVIRYSKNNSVEYINKIDLGDAYKWKIAFLYSNFKIINIFKYDALKFISIDNSYPETRNRPTSEYHSYLMNLKKEDEDYFNFTQNLWNRYEASQRTIQPEIVEQKNLFIEYLKDNSLDLEIAKELESLSIDVISKGYFHLSIYECLTYYDTNQLTYQNPISDSWDDLYEHYFNFIVSQIRVKTGVDLTLFYGLVVANDNSEYQNFIDQGYWSSNKKNVYSQYVSKFAKGSMLALHSYKNEDEILIHAIGTIVEDFENDKHIKVKWNDEFEPYSVEMNSGIGRLDFYEVEPEKAKYKFEEIKNIFYKIKQMDTNKTPLNQILYGPPGTGKTYKTKELAVNIILGEEKRTRKEILQLYKELKQKEQISFTTFHQSMSYEDFVEGIKPVMANEDDESLKYEIEKGIFKRISSKAKGISGSKKKDSSIDFAKSNYFKMSLGGKNKLEVHNWCIENNLVSLGWGDNEDYSEYKNIKSWTEFRDKFNEEFSYLVEGSKYHIQAMFSFQKMKIGDIVLVSLGNHVLDAVGVIDGDYNYDVNNQFGYHHNRKVKWLSTNMNASPELFVDKGISQQSIYEFNKQDIKVQSFRDYFSTPDKPEVKLNHVLIIDEINRGNISSIFGELITLLEQDKRSGADEEIEVILPYSKEPFTVPSNLYIIGTMNTADRSVEALDTALRRRFSFTEIPPDSDILKEANTQEGIVDDINLISLLDTINNRIEILIDKDHKIGHSYFINVSSLDDLVQTFKDKVIPLLEEYFYGDFGKIGLVLGKAFIDIVKQEDKAKLMKFDHEDSDILSERKLYCFTDIKKWDVKSFQSIYDTSIVLNG